MVYLDNAATTLRKPPQVYAAVQDALRSGANAGRGGYAASQAAGARIYECREAAAALFRLEDPARVVFTYNATMGLNMAIKGILPDGGHAVISGYEHNAVVRPLQALEPRHVTWKAAEAPLFQPEAQIEAFRREIVPGTALVVCTQVSNVFGCILPIREIDALCWEKGVPLVVDASQSAGAVPLDAGALRAAAFVCMPGHKGLYGPQGTGMLLVRRENAGTLLEGGTGSESASYTQPKFLPDRFESGTLNAAGIAGLAQGIRFVAKTGVSRIGAHEKRLMEYASEELGKIPGLRLFTGAALGDASSQGGVLSFQAEAMAAQTLAQALASGGIAVRAGLHCAGLAHRTAGTLRDGTVRVSFSAFNTQRDVEMLAAAVRAALRMQRLPESADFR